VAGLDLSGKRAVVTGAGGMGFEVARALASVGAEVTVAGRNRGTVDRAAAEIAARTGNAQVRAGLLDLTDPRSVRRFAEDWSGPLHILVNNAAAMVGPEARTPQGWELLFATNHVGHFALTTGLHDALAAAGGARVVSVSSSAHLFTPVRFDDIHFREHPYDRWLAYGQSKTANVLFAVEVTSRWAGDGITANALMPGVVLPEIPRVIVGDPGPIGSPPGSGPLPTPKSVEQGAAGTVLLAASPLLAGIGGRYFEDCQEAGPHQPGTRRGVAAYALDPEAAARLWAVSVDMLAAT
jgi:NAD(P)-dependent dehydrogenase (short-subunit alcohol dehydrogenase family)